MKRIAQSLGELLLFILIMQVVHSCQQCNTNSKLDELIKLQENKPK